MYPMPSQQFNQEHTMPSINFMLNSDINMHMLFELVHLKKHINNDMKF